MNIIFKYNGILSMELKQREVYKFIFSRKEIMTQFVNAFGICK